MYNVMHVLLWMCASMGGCTAVLPEEKSPIQYIVTIVMIRDVHVLDLYINTCNCKYSCGYVQQCQLMRNVN